MLLITNIFCYEKSGRQKEMYPFDVKGSPEQTSTSKKGVYSKIKMICSGSSNFRGFQSFSRCNIGKRAQVGINYSL